ncbi:MAG: hypothetical protein ACLTDR_00240 [Adlercreutzia equolifaciens]
MRASRLRTTRPWWGLSAQCVRHPNATPLTYHVHQQRGFSPAPNDGACVMVDPSPDDAACIGRIAEACASARPHRWPPAVTHDHFDHAECAEEAGRVFARRCWAWRRARWALGPLNCPECRWPSRSCRCPATPAIRWAFLVEEGALVVTGDVVFAQSPTMVCWPDGRMGDLSGEFGRARAPGGRARRGAPADGPRAGDREPLRAHRAGAPSPPPAAAAGGVRGSQRHPRRCRGLSGGCVQRRAARAARRCRSSVNAQLRLCLRRGHPAGEPLGPGAAPPDTR